MTAQLVIVSTAQLDFWFPDFDTGFSQVGFLEAAAGAFAFAASSTQVANTCGVLVVTVLACVEVD